MIEVLLSTKQGNQGAEYIQTFREKLVIAVGIRKRYIF